VGQKASSGFWARRLPAGFWLRGLLFDRDRALGVNPAALRSQPPRVADSDVLASSNVFAHGRNMSLVAARKLQSRPARPLDFDAPRRSKAQEPSDRDEREERHYECQHLQSP